MWQISIIGAGGWGREVLAQMQSDIAHGKEWVVKGFLDDRPHALDGFDCGLPILGSPMTYQPQPGDAFVCAIGDPRSRRRYAQPLLQKNALFIEIRTDTWLNPRVHLGRGCFLSPRVHVSPDVHIGEFANIHSQTVISHDVHLGDYCQIGAMVFVGGKARIGPFAVVHPHATILPGIEIGEGATVGAGAVVVKNVPAGATVFGNPARVIFHAPPAED